MCSWFRTLAQTLGERKNLNDGPWALCSFISKQTAHLSPGLAASDLFSVVFLGARAQMGSALSSVDAKS